ncbi:MAG: hypothetical protein WCC14_01890, partial [Acidobacteriaceae bacterium]
MKTVTTTYVTSANEAACLTGGASEDIPTVPATQITTLDNGEESEVKWYYDCNTPIFGPTQLVQKQEYDFGTAGGKIGPLLRTTDYDWLNLDFPAYYGVPSTTYPSARHILDRKTSVIVYDGSGKLLSKTLYTYDNNDEGTEGILTKTQKWRSTDGAMLTTTWNNWEYTYPNGTTVTYGFTNKYAGGENPSTAAYPTTITTVANGVSYVQQRQYYYGSGLVAASCGNNYSGTCKTGQSNVPDYTSYTYDLMGRETSTIAGDGGETTTCYSDDPGSSCYLNSGPVRTVTTKLIQSGVSEGTTNISMYAGSGGVPTTTDEITSDPSCSGGTVNVDTTYDPDGRKSTVSNPYCTTKPSASTSGTTTYSYDGLSRVIQVTNPDGTTATNTYAGRAVLSADEGNGTDRIERITQKDALGRLIDVCEITGTAEEGTSGTPASCGLDLAGTGFLTTYGYDASNGPLDAVTSVTQGAESRSFTYDSLGEILSATNPESGTTNYTTYDSMGNLTSKTSAKGITTTYSYNGLNQLLSESYSDGVTASSCFQYGQSTSGNGMGRLIAEWTQAAGSSCSSTVPSDGAITERSFTYDLMGRTATDQQCTSIEDCGTGTASAEVSYTYDLAGDVASFTNGMSGGSAMSFASNYNGADELASVTGPDSPGSDSGGNFNLFTGNSYTPSGAIANALVGPGVALTRNYNDRLLPTNESDVVGSTSGTATLQIAGAEEVSAFSSGNITFSGTEQSMTSDGTTVYDQGNIMVQINGYAYQVPYGEGSTPQSLASYLASIMTCGSGPNGLVQADAVGATVYFASCSAGLNTNYTISAFDDGHSSGFANYSFTPTASGANMTEVTSAPTETSSNALAFGETESSGMSSVYTIVVYAGGSNDLTKIITLDASSTSTPDTLAATLVSDLGSCSTSGVAVSGVVSGTTVTLEPCQSGTSYYFEGQRDACSGGSGSCISMTFINPELPGVSSGAVYDTGTISLTVNGTQIASTSYGEGSTPGSIVSALITASSGNTLVNLEEGDCSGDSCALAVTALDSGTSSDYSYSVNVDDTATAFSGTSFAASAASGSLESGTNVPLYSWAINTYAPDGDVLAMTDSVEGTWSYTYDDMNRVLSGDATSGPDDGMDLAWTYDRYGNRWS